MDVNVFSGKVLLLGISTIRHLIFHLAFNSPAKERIMEVLAIPFFTGSHSSGTYLASKIYATAFHCNRYSTVLYPVIIPICSAHIQTPTHCHHRLFVLPVLSKMSWPENRASYEYQGKFYLSEQDPVQIF